MDIVFVESVLLSEEPFTTAEVIAEYSRTNIRSVNKLITTYKEDLEVFGLLRFQIAKLEGRGRPKKIYKLNEQQATLLITYLDNTEPVRKFKQQLVSQFFSMKQELMRRQAYRDIEKPVRKSLTDAIKNSPYTNKWTYKLITDLICKKVTGYNTKQLKENRNVAKSVTGTDIYSSDEFGAYQNLETKVITLLEIGMDYKQIKSVLNGESIQVVLPIKEKV